jgi:sulfur carrier protein
MKLVVNGDEVESKQGLNVNEFLLEQEVKMPEMVSVELNGEILPRAQFEETQLSENDKVEFLYFMGGGTGGSTNYKTVVKHTNGFRAPNVREGFWCYVGV